MKESFDAIKSWNGKMPLVVSIEMICFLTLLLVYFGDFLYKNDLEDLLFFIYCCSIQYFFLVFFRRFLFLKSIPSLCKIITLYFITYLVITEFTILFDLRSKIYERLLYLGSWFWIIFFYKENILKNMRLLILNPKFWLEVIWMIILLFIIASIVLYIISRWGIYIVAFYMSLTS
ncbi:MAG: hypothetical protein IKV03_00420 [Alphaproteobacteria bacterium]|nr:hypothetical protein [Alphaproteobacteria bacterium]